MKPFDSYEAMITYYIDPTNGEVVDTVLLWNKTQNKMRVIRCDGEPLVNPLTGEVGWYQDGVDSLLWWDIKEEAVRYHSDISILLFG